MNLVFNRLRGLLSGIACTATLLAAPTAYAQSFSTLMFFEGVSPTGNVVMGHDGALYGPTTRGGNAFAGLFYRLTADAAAVNTIYQYGLTYDANLERIFLGADPVGQMLLASDGYFYGVTQNSHRFGGNGTIYRMTQGGANYTKLFEFEPLVREGEHQYLVNRTGAFPSALIEGPDGYLYGVTFQGGRRPADNPADPPVPSGLGTIFKIRRDGSGFEVLHSFREATRIDTPATDDGNATEIATSPEGPRFVKNLDGANPSKRLLLASDGRLYGVTSAGGANGTGVIFSLNTDGTDYRYVTFNESPPNPEAPPENPDPMLPPPTDPTSEFYGYGKRKLNETGSYPATSLVQIGNRIYGTTSLHGAYPAGSVDPNDPAAPPTSPTAPRYSSNAGYGTLFSIDLSSAPIIQVEFNFTGGENNSLTVPPRSMPSRPGSDASGDLIVINGNTIVGTTQTGGILNDATAPTGDTAGVGSVYKFNTGTNTFTSIFVFGSDANHTGAFPSEGVIAVPEAGDYAYYGVTSTGGAWGQGTAFKVGLPVANRAQGTPEPYDDGGGSIGKWLIAALVLLVAIQLIAFRHRRARLQRVQTRDRR